MQRHEGAGYQMLLMQALDKVKKGMRKSAAPLKTQANDTRNADHTVDQREDHA